MRRLFASVVALLGCSDSASAVLPKATGGEAQAVRGIEILVSGERIARDGFAFPPSTTSPAYFVDGWEVKLSHLYVSFGGISIHEEPNKDANDQSVTGPLAASLPGSFIADVTDGDAPGVAEGDRAWQVGKILQKTNGAQFEADRTFAFGVDMIPAQAEATRIGIRNTTDVEEMVARGYSVLYTGVATFQGRQCVPEGDIGTASEVHFRLGFRTRSQSINCLNPELGQAGEASPRGLVIRTNGLSRAQITFHVDHPFWSMIQEEAPLRFDPLAFIARQRGKGTEAAPLVLEDLQGVPYVQISSNGQTLRERSCPPAPAPASLSDLTLDPKGRSVADLYEFVSLLQASMVHMNGDGLCAVRPLP